LWLEKRGLTTPEALKRVARMLGVRDRDVGYAGMKDRHAVTRQWISVPDVDPAIAEKASGEGWRILEARRHGNKLRLGHLDGNRFEVVLTEVLPDEAEVLASALNDLGRTGVPNWYGEQRFGRTQQNAAAGLAILRGQNVERDRHRRRFLLSALQSAVFNRTLVLRNESGLLRVLMGDVLQKVASGGMFTSAEPAVDQARVDAGEVVPTGPMPGSREMKPPPGSEARALEDQAAKDVGLDGDELAREGRDLPGARRPVVVPVTLGHPVVGSSPEGVRLRFSLPAGSYATVLLRTLAEKVVPRAALAIEPPSADKGLP
jgi:tRNA pseudouridine13 synthase